MNLRRHISSHSGSRVVIALALILCVITASFGASAKDTPSSRKFKVTLDAGHGGHDTGALGVSSNEKTITLAVVKLLGAMIEQTLGNDVDVVYTRDGDYFVTLQGRADIANQSKSDLFISVHINSVAKTSKNRNTVQGCQVYTLGLHKTEDNLNVAKQENSVMELEEDNSAHYSDFNPDSHESDIAFELFQTKRLEQSIELAEAIHSELVNTAGRQPRGVRQAGFWVLWATSMPSVLVELDFICNPDMESYLNSKSGQQEMATAIYNAFCTYLGLHGKEIIGHSASSGKVRLPAKNSGVPPASPASAIQPIPGGEGTYENPYYRIQIATSSRPLNGRSPELKSYPDISYYLEDGAYKYTLGPYSTPYLAGKALEKVRADFPDAFVIIMVDGKRAGMLNPHNLGPATNTQTN